MRTTFNQSIIAVVIALTCLSDGPWTTTPTLAEGARILAVETVGAKSHWNFMSGIIRALLERGHHVTAFTPFPGVGVDPSDPGRGNYTEVDTSGVIDMIPESNVTDQVHALGNPISLFGFLVASSWKTCDVIYGHPGMQRILRGRTDDAVFDAVLIEPQLSECVLYVAHMIRSPLIYAIPIPFEGILLHRSTGHFPHPAVQSHIVARHARPVTFAQRLTNALLTAYWNIGAVYYGSAFGRTSSRTHDRLEPVTPSLVFFNGHFVTNASNAWPADVVHVGGVHLKPARPLPRDISEFIENSSHGVIIFTLGSCSKISTLPEHLKKAIFEALSQVPQRVLLKYENDDMEEKSKNIMTLKWLPQRDILEHPNVILFISHGGISGLYEAVDSGVPVLGFPIFVDQHRNRDSLVSAGMAISMDLLTLTKDVFLNNVLELLNNKKYMKNAKTASDVFKDRPLSPAEQVVYSTEYVIRHKGARHLKSHAINLTWYQYYMLDVISVILIFLTVTVIVLYKFLKFVYKYVVNFLRKVKVKYD